MVNKKTEIEKIYSLSPMQQGMLFHWLTTAERGTDPYFRQCTFTIKGEANIPVFEKSVNLLIERYDVLRTLFIYDKIREPRQVVIKEAVINIEFSDLSDLSGEGEAFQSHIEEFCLKDREKGFDLTKGPLIRVSLFKREERSFALVWSYHHIIMDGWCLGILFADLMRIYRGLEQGEMPGLDPVTPYRDYIRWLENGDQDEGLRYWRQYLGGYDSKAALLVTGNATEQKEYRPQEYKFTLMEESSEFIKNTANENRVTVNTLCQCIWGILLMRWNNTDDVVFGVTVSGRPFEIQGIERMVGLFINTVPVRIRQYRGQRFSQLLKTVQADGVISREYEYSPLTEIQGTTSLKGDLIDHIFVFENYPYKEILESAEQEDTPVFVVEEIEYKTQTHYHFNVIITQEAVIGITFNYNAAFYDSGSIEMLGNQFRCLISQVKENPQILVEQMSLLSSEEKRRFLETFNDGSTGFPADKTIHVLFEEQVGRDKDHTALTLISPKDDPLSAKNGKASSVLIRSATAGNRDFCCYGELHEQSDGLARLLLEAGIKQGGIAAIMVEPSINTIVGILGILKSGAAYLPLDPEYPPERLVFMLKDSAASIMLTTRTLFEKAQAITNSQIIIFCLDELNTVRSVEGDILNFSPPPVSPAGPAYIIYTSGTTGEPKGVIVQHKNVVRLFFNDRSAGLFDFGSSDTWTLFHSFNFDFSVWEIFGALLYGGRLVIFPRLLARDTKIFLGILETEAVSVLNQTPSAFYNLIDVNFSGPAAHLFLKYVIFGGEALNPIKLRKWREMYPLTKYINMFGITETTVHVTYKEIGEREINENISNIGTAIPTLTTYVLGYDRLSVPIGVSGELYVGGEGLARGYLNSPALTHDRFVDDSYNPGGKLYRSGDMVKLLPDGDMEYAGRIDHQVQVRGYRVELGEIQDRLLKNPEVKDAFVAARVDKDGNINIYAYIVSKGSIDMPGIRKYLSAALPAYMVPQYFIQVDALPLTPNGKIDREVLSLMESTELSMGEYTAPRNSLEESIAEAWREVLGVARAGITDNFFSLGGDSIKAIKLVAAVNKRIEFSINIADIFANETIEELAEAVSRLRTDDSLSADLQRGLEEMKRIKDAVLSDEEEAIKLPGNYEDIYPLTPIESGMIYLSMANRSQPIYYDQFTSVVKISDYEIFKKAIAILIGRHPILRSKYYITGFKHQVKIVLKEIDSPLRLEDISALSADLQREKIKAYMEADIEERYSFSGDILWKIKTFRLASTQYFIVWSVHHTILDGWSTVIFKTELSQILSALETGKNVGLPDLTNTYKEYCAIIMGRRISEKTGRFWKKTLDGYTRTALPFNYSGMKKRESIGMNMLNRQFEQRLLRRLEKIASEEKVSFKSLCLSAYLFLLCRICAQKEIVAGVVTHERPGIENAEKIMGCFLNTIPIRMDISQFTDWLSLIREVNFYLAIVKPYETNLAEIKNFIGEKTTSGNPIFDTLFNYTDIHKWDDWRENKILTEGDESLSTASDLYGAQMTNTLLDLEVDKTQGFFKLRLKYVPSYFENRDMEYIAELYARILGIIAENPQGRLKEADLLSESEKKFLLLEFNDTVGPYPDEKTMHSLFEDQVKRTPGFIALRQKNEEISYGFLHSWANQVSRLLISGGVKQEENVGIKTQRRFEMIAGMMGILKSGGSYVPIDPEYPSDRQNYLIVNSNCRYVLVDGTEKNVRAGDERQDMGFEAILIKPYLQTVNRDSEGNANPDIPGRNMAYTIYTSGTTGRPKGVMIEHNSAVNLILWVNETFAITAPDRLLFITSMCFDLSVYDIFGTLACGAVIVMAEQDEVRDMRKLKRIMKDEKITFWDSVPTTMNYLMKEIEESEENYIQNDLRLVFMSGDWIPVDLPDRIKKHFPGARTISLGGATEGTVWSNHFPIEEVAKDWPSIPYGKPIRNNFFYILDEYNRPVPTGVVGELHIGGLGVARGYANEIEKSDMSYIPDPFNHLLGDRMYKTGDLGRMLHDGNMEFIGRKDHQVKIRGFRVEIGEVENQLADHDTVADAVVAVKQDRDNNNMLIAYVVLRENIEASLLKEFLKGKIPEYMVPSYIVPIEKMPLTISGKINRKALPEIDENEGAASDKYQAPENIIEEKLVQMWKELLGKEVVNTIDNFFDLGGHSLMATSMISKIHKTFNVEVPVIDFFAFENLHELASYIKDRKTSGYFSIPAIEKREYYPLSAVQSRVYFLDQLEKIGTSYNMPVIQLVEGKLDTRRVGTVIRSLIQHHEPLRTAFPLKGDSPVQRIYEKFDFQIEYYEMGSEIADNKVEQVVRKFIRRFKLDTPPLLRIGLIKILEDRQILMFDMHHIICDGISSFNLRREFVEAYSGGSPAEVRIQYKDFSVWQLKFLESDLMKKQEEYWLHIFSGKIPVLDLPTDYQRPQIQSFAGDFIHFQWDEELTAKIYRTAKNFSATLYMVLLAIYNVLLSKYSGQDDIIVGTPIAGRPHVDLENIQGMFINTLAVRNYPGEEKEFAQFLKEVKNNALEAYENQDFQFENLVEKLDIKRDPGRQPLFDTMLSVQNISRDTSPVESKRDSGELCFKRYEFEDKISQFDIVVEVFEAENRLFFLLKYGTALFKRETIENFVMYFEEIARIIVDNIHTKIGDFQLSHKLKRTEARVIRDEFVF